MASSVLLLVMQAFADTLGASEFGDTSPIFGASNERIYFQGEQVSWNTLPIARLEFGDDVATELKQTTKTTATLPVALEVVFDDATIPTAPSLRARHTELLQRVKDQIMSNRELGGPALDVDWTSGGAKLTPVTFDQGRTADQKPDAWMFTVNFNIVYRQKTGDSTSPV